jgi:hypothetical protein
MQRPGSDLVSTDVLGFSKIFGKLAVLAHLVANVVEHAWRSAVI